MSSEDDTLARLVAEELFSELDDIEAEELWDRAGPSRHGYSSPDDMAVEMIDEVLEPFTDKVEEYRRIGMAEQCKLYCMGVLKGLYRFEHESRGVFRERAPDIPGECFGAALGDWRKHASRAEVKDMEAFLLRECPEWAGSTRRATGAV